MRPPVLLMLTLLAAMVLVVDGGGCAWTPSVGANGSDVGGACGSDVGCDETCVTGSPFFPGGLCTWRCNADTDCPKASVCSRIVLAGSGGFRVCVNTCQTTADCRTGYQCESVPKSDGTSTNGCWVPGTVAP